LNLSWGIYLSETSASNEFSKNVISGGGANPDSCVLNEATSEVVFDFTRNWWGTTDSSAIRAKIGGTSEAHRDSIIFSPYRLDTIDTAPGADTVAPAAPDTVAASAIDSTSILVTWSTSMTSEEPEISPMLNGYRIYRSPTAETSLWVAVGEVNSSITDYLDTELAPSTQYYYRVTAFDNWPIENQSWYSDSIAGAMTQAGGETRSVTLLPIPPRAVQRDFETTVMAVAVWSADMDAFNGAVFRFARRDGNSFAAMDLDSVTLWVDANGNLEVDPGIDTYVAQLMESTGAWEGFGLGLSFLPGETKTLLVGMAVGEGDARPGETFTVRIDSGGFFWAGASPIPAAALWDTAIHVIQAGAEFNDSAYALQVNEITLPDTLYIIAADFLANLQSGAADTIMVEIVNLSRGESEPVILSEWGIDSGEFIGALAVTLDPADSIAASGRLYAQHLDVIGLFYDGILYDTILAFQPPPPGMIRVTVDTFLPAGGPIVVAWQETTTFIVVRIEGDTVMPDTLTAFRVVFDGAGGNIASPISLYEDIGGSFGEWDGGDAFIADLTPLGSGAFGLAAPYSLETWEKQFIVVGRAYDTATLGETVHAFVPGMSVKSVNLDTGPVVNLHSAGIFQFAAPPPVFVQVDTALPMGATVVAALADTLSLISVFVQGDTNVGDTLGLFRIAIEGNPANLETIELWNDINWSYGWDLADTFVATMTPIGGGVYEVADAGVWLDPGGTKFVVVGYLHDTATPGDTFRAAMPAYGVKTARFDTAPAASFPSPALFTIAPPIQLLFTAGSFFTPDTGEIMLIDLTANTDTMMAEEVWLDIVNLRTGETEMIAVNEQSVDTAYFLGQFPISNDSSWIASYDGVIHALPGDTLRAIYASGPTMAEVSIETRPTTFLLVHQNAPPSDTIVIGVTDTVSLISLTIGGDSSPVDSTLLVSLYVVLSTSPGLVPGDVEWMRLYRDLDKNGLWSPGDEFVSALPFDTAFTSFGNDAINYAIPLARDSFLVAMRGSNAVAAGETLQAFIPSGSVTTRVGPLIHLSAPESNAFSPAVFTTAFLPLAVVVDTTLAGESLARDVDHLTRTAMRFAITGDTATIVNAIAFRAVGAAAEKIANPALYADADANGHYSIGDTMLTSFMPDSNGRWMANPGFLPSAYPAPLLLTFDLTDTVAGETLQVLIEPGEIVTDNRAPAPLAPLWSSAVFAVTYQPPVIVVDTTLAGESLARDVDHLTRTAMRLAITGDSMTMVNAIAFRAVGAAAEKIANPTLYADADANGHYSMGDTMLTGFMPDSNGRWTAYPGFLPSAYPAPLLLTFDLTDTVAGETFQVMIEPGEIVTNNRSLAPAAPLMNPAIFTVTYQPPVIVVDTTLAGETLATEYPHFTRTVMRLTITGDTATTLGAIAVRLAGSAAGKIANPTLYADADANGHYSMGDTMLTGFMPDSNGRWTAYPGLNLADYPAIYLLTLDIEDTVAGETFQVMIEPNEIVTSNRSIAPVSPLLSPAVFAFAPTPDTVPPTTPEPLEPFDGLDTNQLLLFFAWTAVSDTGSGLLGYRLQFDTSSVFSPPIIDTMTAATSTIMSLSANQTWYWRVVAVDSATNTSTSAIRIVRVDTAPPTAPGLLAPADALETTATSLTLSWSASTDSLAGVAVYRIQVASDSTFAAPLIDDWTVNTSYPAAALAPDMLYYWRVQAIDSATNVALSALHSFRITLPPAPPCTVTVAAGLPASGTINPAGADLTQVIAVTVKGDPFGDTLIRFRIAFTGPAGQPSMIETVALYRNASRDGLFNATVDEFVADLPLSTGMYGSDLLAIPLYDWMAGEDSFVVVVSLRDTALAGDTLRAAIPMGQVRTTLRDSAPPTALLSPATFTITVVRTELIVDLLKPSGRSISPLGVDRTAILAATIGGTLGDSLTGFTVVLTGGAAGAQIDTVWLARDVDCNGDFALGTDVFEATLVPSAGGRWSLAAPISFGAAAADSFLVVVSLRDTSPGGDTLVAYIPAQEVKVASRDSAPLAAVYAPGVFLVESGVSTIVGVAINPNTVSETIAPIGVDLTRVMAFAVQGAPNDTLTRLTVRLDGPAGAPSRLDYVVLYRDANNNGRFDSGIDPEITLLAWLSGQTYYRGYLTQSLGASGVESFVLVLSYKDSSPSGETVHAVIPAFGTKTALRDTGPAIEFKAPAAFTIYDLNPPSAFSLSAPATNSDTNANPVVFSWNASSDPGSGLKDYRIQISRNATFSSYEVNTTTVALGRIYSASLAAEDTYWWRVIASDMNGNARYSTETFRVRVDRTVPSQPSLSTPAANTETTATTIGFAWGSASDTGSGLLRYRLQIATDPGFTSVAVDSATGLTLSALRSLSSEAVYYWRVLAEDRAGNVRASDSRRLAITSGGPSAPTLLDPADLIETANVSIRFRWSPSADSVSTVTGYRLQLDTAIGFFAPAVDAAVGLDTSSLQVLAGNRTWYWRVLATNAASLTTASATRTLILDDQIAVAPFSPADGVTTQDTEILFVWSSDGDTFELQIGADTSGGALAIQQSAFSNSVTPDTPLASGTWFWRVLARDNAGNRETSVWFQLTVDTSGGVVSDTSPPAPFDLRSPAAGAWMGATSVPFRWYLTSDTPSGMASYVLQAASDTSFAAIVASETVSATRDTATLILGANATYYWRVIAVDAVGNGRFSNAAWLVGVDTMPPLAPLPLLSPASGADTSAATVGFRWSAAVDTLSGIVAYRLQIDTAPGFSAPRLDTTLAALTHAQAGLETGVWHWRVAAVDSVGNVSAWLADTFRISRDQPSAPGSLQPADTFATANTSVAVAWAASTPASAAVRRYQVEAARDSGFGSAEKSVTTLDTTTAANLTSLVSGRWYWRVQAEDWAGNLSAWSATSTFLVDTATPVVATFSAPAANTVTRLSTISCTWSVSSAPASGIAGYRLEAIDPSAVVIVDSFFASSATSYGVTLGGFGEGAHSARVRVMSNAGTYGESSPVSFAFDFTPPSGVAALDSPKNGAETTVTAVGFTVSTAGVTETGPAGATVRILFQASRSTNFDTPLTSQLMTAGAVAFTPTYLFDETGAYYWRVAAADQVGNVGAFSGAESFVRPPPPDTVPPVPVANLEAVADDNLGITLTWMCSPSSDMAAGGQYNVFWNEGNLNATAETLLKIVPHTGVETYTYRVHDDTTLRNSVNYSFTVRAQDNVGNVEQNNATVSVAARLAAVNACYATFITPKAGHKVNRTGGIQVVVQIENDAYRNFADTLTLQYRRVGASNWSQMTPSENAASANPIYIGGDSKQNHGMHWDAVTDNVTVDTDYELRALVTDRRTGDTSLSLQLAVTITVRIVGNAADADVTSSAGGDTGEIEQKVDSRRDNEIEIASGDGSSGSVDLPVDSLDETTDTSDAKAKLKSDPGHGNSGGGSGAGLAAGLASGLAVNTALGTDSGLTNAVTVELPGGQATLRSGKTAAISTSYNVDTWGFIQTWSGDSRALSFVSPDTRNIRFYFVPTGGGARVRVDPATLTIDTVNRRISGRSATMGTFIAVMDTRLKGFEIAGLSSDSRGLLSAFIKETDADLAGRLRGDTGTPIVIYDLTFRSGGSRFNNDVYCTIPMPSGYTRDSNFVAYTYSGGTLETVAIAYKLDNWIVLKVRHFSVVTLVVPAVGAAGAPGNQANLNNFMIYPNPYRPNDGNPATGSPPAGAASRTTGIVFDNLPANTKVEIFTMRGERLFEQVVAVADGWVWWNVRNAKTNEDVASGYYIYIVTDQATGQRKTGKLAVIR
jgi:hypothetical protein